MLFRSRGSLQLVFCDIGTPSDDWNVYDELRAQLTSRGLPREAIRYVHDAKTDRDKGELFAACRAGTVAVLIGSTEKMGVGTNVQFRAIALHHLDCPWRPADVAQREGRILRQGNHNPEVQILRYVTEKSFDGYMWQTEWEILHLMQQLEWCQMFWWAGPECRFRAGRAGRADCSSAVSSTGTRSCRSRVPVVAARTVRSLAI